MPDDETLERPDSAAPGESDDTEATPTATSTGTSTGTATPRARFPLALVVAGVLLVVALAATALGGVVTNRDAAAASVNGREVARRDFERFLRALTLNKAFVASANQSGQQIVDAAGRPDARLTANVLASFLVGELADGALERRGVTASRADRSSGTAFVTQSYPGFPRWWVERYVRIVAAEIALDRVLGGNGSGQRANAYLDAALLRARVTIDPRYGRFDRRVARGTSPVLPPAVPQVSDERPARSTTTARAAPIVGG